MDSSHCANTLRYPLNPPDNPVGWVLTNEKLNNSPEVTWLVSGQEMENLVCQLQDIKVMGRREESQTGEKRARAQL